MTTEISPPENSSELRFPPEPQHQLDSKTRILGYILGYCILLGIQDVVFPMNDRFLDQVLTIPVLICGIMWCKHDAEERGKPLTSGYVILLILLFVIVFPIYLLRSRGFIRGFIANLLLLGFVFLMMVAMMLGGIVAAIPLGIPLEQIFSE